MKSKDTLSAPSLGTFYAPTTLEEENRKMGFVVISAAIK